MVNRKSVGWSRGRAAQGHGKCLRTMMMSSLMNWQEISAARCLCYMQSDKDWIQCLTAGCGRRKGWQIKCQNPNIVFYWMQIISGVYSCAHVLSNYTYVQIWGTFTLLFMLLSTWTVLHLGFKHCTTFFLHNNYLTAVVTLQMKCFANNPYEGLKEYFVLSIIKLPNCLFEYL